MEIHPRATTTTFTKITFRFTSGWLTSRFSEIRNAFHAAGFAALKKWACDNIIHPGDLGGACRSLKQPYPEFHQLEQVSLCRVNSSDVKKTTTVGWFSSSKSNKFDTDCSLETTINCVFLISFYGRSHRFFSVFFIYFGCVGLERGFPSSFNLWLQSGTWTNTFKALFPLDHQLSPFV